ncbi:hypothetical protein [Psychromicrobium xiongbiense]|uniref:hypothetical protein n=1 Tax=Psychromicrobium xiongbiense TaxID=3051184 RepID=UPI002555E3B9|nr:hypothetical protein [Psychromicrobium sp. YIM S02556]
MKRSASAVLLAVALALTGCTGGGASGAASAAGVPSDEPLDTFPAKDLVTVNDAVMTLQYQCYARNGYSQFLEVLAGQKANHFANEVASIGFVGITVDTDKTPWFRDEADAKRRGFGVLGAGWPDVPARVNVRDQGFQAVEDSCALEATSKVAASKDLFLQIRSVAHDLMSQVLATKPAELWDRVYTCMDEAGFKTSKTGEHVNSYYGRDFGIQLGASVRPSYPQPDPNLQVQIMPGVKTAQYVPTAEEVQMALAMHKCSQSTGAQTDWDKRLHDAKVKAVAANEAVLIELKPKIEAMVKAAAALSL